MLSQSQRNAFTKAARIRGWEAVTRMEHGRYLVKSASSTRTYVVTGMDRLGQDHTCSCEAGIAGRFCWHKAAVVLARQRHEWQVAQRKAAGTPAPTILEPARSAHSLRRVSLV